MRYTVLDIVIPAGQSSFTDSISLDAGKVVKVALFTKSTPAENITLGVDDQNNKAIHPPVPYQEFQPTNGNHFESRKDLIFDGDRKVKVVLNADANLAAEFKGSFMFYIQEND